MAGRVWQAATRHTPVRVTRPLSTAVFDCTTGLLYPVWLMFSRLDGENGLVLRMILSGGVEYITRHRFYVSGGHPGRGAIPAHRGRLPE